MSTLGWISYSSPRNGYSAKIPPDWTTTDARVSWAYGTVPNEFADLFWDRLQPPVGVPHLFGTSQKLPNGTVAGDWICAELSTDPGSPCVPGAFVQVEIGGTIGSLAQPHSIEFIAAVVVQGRGYLFAFAAASATRDQRQLLDALLAGIRLQPERAIN